MRFVDFYFDFSSTNSYFAAFLLPEICARNDARVNWMPAHFAALFRGTGFDVMAMTPRKARYLWRDHARYAEATGLPFRKPSRFPIKTASALRAVLAAGHAAQADDGGESREHAQRAISQAIMRAYWERDEDIADRDVLASIATRAGFDGAALMNIANEKAARDELAALTQTAVARGVFGAPMFSSATRCSGARTVSISSSACLSVRNNRPCFRQPPFFATLFVRIREHTRRFDASKWLQNGPTIRSQRLDTV